MRCPYCTLGIRMDSENDDVFFHESEHGDGAAVLRGTCPECGKLLVLIQFGKYAGVGASAVLLKEHEQVIYPPSSNQTRPMPPELPEKIRKDFAEAERVLSISPNASAALSRRLLQHVLRERYKIKKGTLLEEIQEFLASASPPSHVAEALDGVRNVGNYAAHPMVDKITGLIVDAEDGEAEWLLDTLELLFDFAYVQPARLQAKKDAVNAKLRKLGKPEMP